MRPTVDRPLPRFELALLCCALLAGEALAQLPVTRLHAVFPAGAKQGSTVDLLISGVDLEDVSQLHFSDPGITAVQKTQPPGLGQEGPQPVPQKFTVTIAPTARLGLCEVRAIGKYGVSNPRTFVVSDREETFEQEPNHTRENATPLALGTIANAQADPNDRDFYKITAQAGQRIIVDCWAYRIDSRMDPSLVLYDATGKELDRNRDMNRRDPLLDFTAPADGDYYVEVNDFLYAGGGEHFYRLEAGTGPYLDFVFPPAGQPGTKGKYTLYGRNLPGGTPSELKSADGKPLDALEVEIELPTNVAERDLTSLVEPDESAIDDFSYRLQTAEGLSNSVPVGYATAPVVVEQDANDEPGQAQVVTTPCEIAGKFYPRDDRDWYTFNAKKGEALWIEVLSQRLGLSTDPLLIVQHVTKNEQGEEQVKELHAVDDYLENPAGQVRRGMAIYDMKTKDPAFRFVAPEEGTYRILVRNLASYTHDDPRLVYRLAIRPAEPDFRVVVKPRLLPFSADPNQNPPTLWSPLLRKGGTELLDVVVFRRDGFDGPVEVSTAGLPAGVTAPPVTVGAGQTVGEIVLRATDDAPEGIGLLTFEGKAQIGGKEVSHPARTATMIWGGVNNQITPRSRLARNLAVAVSGAETMPFVVEPGTTTLEMSKAGKVELPVKVTRRGDFKGNIALAPSRLPPNVKPPALTLDEKTAEGKIEFELPPNTPPGTYSFALLATTQVNYARNPEAVTAATARKEAVDKIAAELAEASKAAVEAKAVADKQAADSAAAMQQAAAAATEAAKAAEEAAAKAKAAAEAKVVADKAMADAAAQAKAAAEAKATAEKAAAEADAKVKEAGEVQKVLEKQVADATNAAKPKALNVAAPSPTVTLTVTEAPLKLEATAPAAVPPGGKVEVPLQLTRLYGFADAVQVVTQTGDGKIAVADLAIPADQADVKLAVDVAADAKPGNYKLTVKATAKFNGQDLSVTSVVPLVVAAPEVAQSP